jgi:hypothetical protein
MDTKEAAIVKSVANAIDWKLGLLTKCRAEINALFKNATANVI